MLYVNELRAVNEKEEEKRREEKKVDEGCVC